MIQKTITQEVLEWFFEHPTTETGLRELSRKLNASLPSTSNAIKKLELEQLVITKSKRPIAKIIANRNNAYFKQLKRWHNLQRLYDSGLIDALKSAHPQSEAIICFGSYSSGDDDEKSDIDIAIFSPSKKEINVRAYETKLGKNIQIIGILPTTNENLKANIRNGVIMDGAL